MIKTAEDFFAKFAVNKKRLILCVVMLVSGIVLCSVSKQAAPKEDSFALENANYISVEQKLCKILEKIQGVGKTDVMVTYRSEDDTHNSYWNSGSKKTQIQGVVVVADGADDARVKSDIIYAVSALLDVELYNIRVYPQK